MNFIEKIKNTAKGLSKSNLINALYKQEEQETMSGAADPSVFQERLKTLTPREKEVYSYLIKGLKMREIASLMNISYSTVNFHCKGLYKKLCVNTRMQLFLQYAALDDSKTSAKE